MSSQNNSMITLKMKQSTILEKPNVSLKIPHLTCYLSAIAAVTWGVCLLFPDFLHISLLTGNMSYFYLDPPASQDQQLYVYNWTEWIDNCGLENCTSNHSHNVFPDGRPFPRYPGWRRRNFVYVFHTFGQYCNTSLSLADTAKPVFTLYTNSFVEYVLIKVL